MGDKRHKREKPPNGGFQLKILCNFTSCPVPSSSRPGPRRVLVIRRQRQADVALVAGLHPDQAALEVGRQAVADISAARLSLGESRVANTVARAATRCAARPRSPTPITRPPLADAPKPTCKAIAGDEATTLGKVVAVLRRAGRRVRTIRWRRP